MRHFLTLERAALRRLRARRGMIALALFGATAGALAFVAAVVKAQSALRHAAIADLLPALAGVPLGLDLALVLGSLAVGAGVAAIARPDPAGRLALPAARSSAGSLSIGLLVFVVLYTLLLAEARLLPLLLDHPGSVVLRAALGALALAPALALAGLLVSGALAGVALVGRGVTPGHALISGLDHVQRQPYSLLLGTIHALVTFVVVALAARLPVSGLARLVLMAPLIAGAMLWTIAAFDAALGADPRLATG